MDISPAPRRVQAAKHTRMHFALSFTFPDRRKYLGTGHRLEDRPPAFCWCDPSSGVLIHLTSSIIREQLTISKPR